MEQWIDDGRSITNVRHLRAALLVPLALALVLIGTVVVTLIENHQHEMLDHALNRTHALVSDVFRTAVHSHTEVLGVAATALERDPQLARAMAQGDRSALLRLARPLFSHLRRRYGLSYLAFIDPAGRVLLRVHNPQRHGDLLESVVFTDAQRSGRDSAGVELGHSGILALRLVSPWRRHRSGGVARSLGYVELGIGIDELARHIRAFAPGALAVVIPKDLVERKAWRDDAPTPERPADWTRFSHLLLVSGDAASLPSALNKYLQRARLPADGTVVDVPKGGAHLHASFVGVRDLTGRHVADIVALGNVSGMATAARRMLWIATVTTAGVGLVLFLFFFWLSGRIARRLEGDERRLNELATRDGLTGLYNHKMFHLTLTKEMSRGARYAHACALLMLDIDHFKRVNDDHGHPAGDRVLADVGARMSAALRAADTVFRYGGEEFTVMLPETNLHQAAEVAERLRQAIADQPFAVGDGAPIAITVSIGVAAAPDQARTEASLIAAADQALYAAKAAGRNRVCICPTAAPVAPIAARRE